MDFNESERRLKFGFLESIFAPVSFVEACFAMDTRDTSPKLLQAAMRGCELMGIKGTNFGLCTTPQLHWLVANRLTHANDSGLYIQYFKENFLTFLSLCQDPEQLGSAESPKHKYQSELYLDCANGVGAPVVEEMMGLAGFSERLKINQVNTSIKDTNLLNENCGAEFVHKERKFPTTWSPDDHKNTKWMSFDGDADRQIYFYGDEGGQL